MKCRKYREWIILYLYGELGQTETTELESHLAGCAECRLDLDETRQTFHLLSEAEPASVPDVDWQKCWGGIRAGLRPRTRPTRRHFLIPRWVPAAAAGLILVFALGLFFGRTLRPRPAAVESAGPELSPAAVDMSLSNHFDALKPLLIDYANSAAPENGTRPGADSALVRSLMIQNILLIKLLAREDPDAAELLEDIDLVLREITNMKIGDRDTPAQIRDLIGERKILFKMDIMKSF